MEANALREFLADTAGERSTCCCSICPPAPTGSSRWPRCCHAVRHDRRHDPVRRLAPRRAQVDHRSPRRRRRRCWGSSRTWPALFPGPSGVDLAREAGSRSWVRSRSIRRWPPPPNRGEPPSPRRRPARPAGADRDRPHGRAATRSSRSAVAPDSAAGVTRASACRAAPGCAVYDWRAAASALPRCGWTSTRTRCRRGRVIVRGARAADPPCAPALPRGHGTCRAGSWKGRDA